MSNASSNSSGDVVFFSVGYPRLLDSNHRPIPVIEKYPAFLPGWKPSWQFSRYPTLEVDAEQEVHGACYKLSSQAWERIRHASDVVDVQVYAYSGHYIACKILKPSDESLFPYTVAPFEHTFNLAWSTAQDVSTDQVWRDYLQAWPITPQPGCGHVCSLFPVIMLIQLVLILTMLVASLLYCFTCGQVKLTRLLFGLTFVVDRLVHGTCCGQQVAPIQAPKFLRGTSAYSRRYLFEDLSVSLPAVPVSGPGGVDQQLPQLNHIAQPQSYGAQPQSYAGQSQSYAGQPQSYSAQPQSMSVPLVSGQPQSHGSNQVQYTVAL
eukprot:TRINITY_DN8020_c0_g1_i2.p1 TRINITY_DN8020_c0_g1~~TRINITY_DN8020_c0_g1_i2.p1  ORF type:complete len:320 (+),score=9.91 TRINITY_DN8020_c0_g1_i2:74-1033(+)